MEEEDSTNQKKEQPNGIKGEKEENIPEGSEVSNEVFLGKHSKVWLQALNRVYLQKSILLYCLDKL